MNDNSVQIMKWNQHIEYFEILVKNDGKIKSKNKVQSNVHKTKSYNFKIKSVYSTMENLYRKYYYIYMP